MKFLPKTLFGRNALLIVVLMIGGQLSTVLLLRELLLRPRLELLTEGVVRNIGAMRAALAALPPAQRKAFVERFNQSSQAGRQPDPETSIQWLAPLEERLVRAVSERLRGEAADVYWRTDAGGSLALKLTVDGEAYWIVLPGVLPGRVFTGVWFAVTLAGSGLAVAGALLIHRRINRPLREVVAAANTLARGGTPPLLPEDGPTETARLSRGFNQLVLSLEQANHERALMLAGVSHDLRTPLTKLRLGTEILGERADPETRGSLVRSIQEMDDIVGQFLDFARVGEAEPTVMESLDALAREQAAAVAAHGYALLLELSDTPAIVLRPNAMRRALANLVENAYRHGAPPVCVRTGTSASAVWIEVADSGPGVPAGEAEVLKQPFRRGDNARGGPPGAGLGLAIVERTVRAHGGTLELLPGVPVGVRARITLGRDSGDTKTGASSRLRPPTALYR